MFLSVRSTFQLALQCVLAIVAQSSEQKPNILLIVADDLGNGDLSYRNGPIRTPNLDYLAKSGLPLDSHYVQSSCSPTRAALMTGRYPARFNIDIAMVESQPRGVPLSEKFLPQVLRTAGYRTHMVGKWHLGSFSWEVTPAFRGFETFFGFLKGGASYFTHLIPWNMPKFLGENEYDMIHQTKLKCGAECAKKVIDADDVYSTHLFTEKAVNIIKKHDEKTPLFLYLAYQAVHGPSQAPRSYVEPYLPMFKSDKLRLVYAGMLSALDEGVGNVTKALKDKGMWENTIIVFTADNGGPTDTCDINGSRNGKYRGGKCSNYEGGTRSEAFISGGALNLNHPGKPYMNMLHAVDWLPTLSEAAGLDPSNLGTLPLDGKSQWQAIIGKNTTAPRGDVFYGYTGGVSEIPGLNKRLGSAVRTEDGWKLVKGKISNNLPLGKLVPGMIAFCTPDCTNCTGSTHNKWTGACPVDPVDSKKPTIPLSLNYTHRYKEDERRSPEAITFKRGMKDLKLFNLNVDVHEDHNVARRHPEVVQRLMNLLNEYEKSTYIEPDEDPAYFHECDDQSEVKNSDGPRGVPYFLPWCQTENIFTNIQTTNLRSIS